MSTSIWKTLTALLIWAMVLPGCGTTYSTSSSQAAQTATQALANDIDAVYLGKCPEPPALSGGHVERDLIPALRKLAQTERDCRLRHNCLVDRLTVGASAECLQP